MVLPGLREAVPRRESACRTATTASSDRSLLTTQRLHVQENGFKCHTMSESHLRQMLLVGESAGKHIADYTSRFQAEFIALLSRR